ncbi:MAG: hypothetical protein AB7G04_06570 [Hyphomonadaceae bacterium]
MTESVISKARPKTPWHLWLVGVLGLFWNGYGAYDYLMTVTRGDPYLREYGMTEAQIAFFHVMPKWMIADWAVGVWGAALGSVLLLLRSRWAFWAFLASLAAMLTSLVYSHFLSDGAEVMGSQGAIMSAIITVACLFFVWYAWAMTKRGVLR